MSAYRNAPDPSQFDQMEQAYSIMAPTALILMALPNVKLADPATATISKVIGSNQANPGTLMRAGANWLQLAEKYSTAADMLEEEIGKLDEGDWDGDDRDAFDGKSSKVTDQLRAISAYALLVGVQLFAIATMFAVLIPIMLACATAMMSLALLYVGWLMVPGGQIAAAAFRTTALGYAASMSVPLKTMDTAITVAGKTLAGLMTVNMTASWIALASKGNLVNPAKTLGSTGFSLLQGLSKLAAGKLLSSGRTSDSTLNKISPKLNDKLMSFGPQMEKFADFRNLYGLGNNIADIAAPDAENKMKDAGVDPFALDFIPNNHGFEDAARGANGGDTPPDQFTMTDEQREALDERRDEPDRSD